MSVEKLCKSCNKPMIGYRRHAETCGSTCRGIRWRSNKTPTVTVKLAFSAPHFAILKNTAEQSGISINNYIISRSIGSDMNTVTTR